QVLKMADIGKALAPSKRTMTVTEQYHPPAPDAAKTQPSPQQPQQQSVSQEAAKPQLPDKLLEPLLADINRLSADQLKVLGPMLIDAMIRRHITMAGTRK